MVEIYRAVGADVELARSRSGREIVAYAALFGEPYEVHDQHGHYRELISRSAFDEALASPKTVPVYVYNHGYRLDGRADPMLSVPLGKPLEIKPDHKGLLTRAELNRSALADAVLEAVKHGDVSSYSFRGAVHESFPSRVPTVQRGGELPLIERRRLGLSDFGPTPLPVNSGARILAVRAMVGMDEEEYEGDPDDNVLHLTDVDFDGLDDDDRDLARQLAALDPEELDRVLELVDEYRGETTRAHIGWDALVSKLVAQGHTDESAARIAHAVAVKKYGASRLVAMAKAGKRAARKARSAARSQVTLLDEYEADRFGRQAARILAMSAGEPDLLRAIIHHSDELGVGTSAAVANLERALVIVSRSVTEPRIREIEAEQDVIVARMVEIRDMPEPEAADEVLRAEILTGLSDEVTDLDAYARELDAELEELLDVDGVVMRSESYAYRHRTGPAFDSPAEVYQDEERLAAISAQKLVIRARLVEIREETGEGDELSRAAVAELTEEAVDLLYAEADLDAEADRLLSGQPSEHDDELVDEDELSEEDEYADEELEEDE